MFIMKFLVDIYWNVNESNQVFQYCQAFVNFLLLYLKLALPKKVQYLTRVDLRA